MKPKTTKKPTRSKSAAPNRAAGNDNSHRIYRVCFTYKQWGDRFIRAASANEAREKAQSIPTAEPGFWKDCPEDFTVIEIDVVEPEAMPKDAAILPIPD